MKKILLFLISMLVLVGCNSPEYKVSVIKEIQNEALKDSDFIQNYHLKYFSFYLPSDMTIIEYDDDSVVLNYRDSNILMNLNASGIVTSKYYSDEGLLDDELFDNNKLIYTNTSTFKSNNTIKSYVLNIYDYSTYYYVHLLTTDINYYCYAYDNNINDLVRHLFALCKSVKTDSEAVLSAYSSKIDIDYTRKQLNLFEYVIPSEGSIDDFMIQQ